MIDTASNTLMTDDIEQEPVQFTLDVNVLYEAIDDLVSTHNINYIDAVVTLCEKNNYDILSVSKVLPPSLIVKIEDDAKRLKLLKKTKEASKLLI
jgi:hypothetical protein